MKSNAQANETGRSFLLENIAAPRTRASLIQEICRGKTVLDLGCVNHDAKNAQRGAWLHKCVVDVAEHVVGIDYLAADVQKLQNEGYNIIQGDVTKPLSVDAKFDVIVVGNLIEHLSNFEGLFRNLQTLLTANGIIAISTANPFYEEQYFFSALKGDLIVNPEHTCWIDPLNLAHLASRFGFAVSKLYWIKEHWKLREVILSGKGRDFDICRGRWTFSQPPQPMESLIGRMAAMLLLMFLPHRNALHIKITSDRLYYQRVLAIVVIGHIFGWAWTCWKLIIPSSRINRYELYMAIIKRQADPCVVASS